MRKPEINPRLKDLPPYSPGLSIQEIKEKYGLEQVYKLASNENPLGLSPLVKQILEAHTSWAFRYPRLGSPELRADIAAFLGVQPGQIVPGNGSNEIIDLLIRVLARPEKDNICAFDPCFSIYSSQARLAGVEFRAARRDERLGFDWERLLALTDEYTRIIFVTNPDNPSGQAVPASELSALAGRIPERAVLVVDEAYVDFAARIETVSMARQVFALPNVVVLRTFSKLFALAGLRLGYGVMAPELSEYVRRAQLPFSVNLLAAEAGRAALIDGDFYSRSREVVLSGREELSRELRDLGCAVWPSQANFLLFTPPADAKKVFFGLLEQGIIIRALASYGLPASLRVSIGTKHENREFVRALEKVLHAQ